MAREYLKIKIGEAQDNCSVRAQDQAYYGAGILLEELYIHSDAFSYPQWPITSHES